MNITDLFRYVWESLPFFIAIVTAVIVIILLSYRKKVKNVAKVINELNEIIKEYYSIIKEINALKTEIKDLKNLTGIEEKQAELKKQEFTIVAEDSARLNFTVKNVYTPRVLPAKIKHVTIFESKPFRKKFKKLIYVETDAPSQLIITLNGDLDKFIDLSVIIYNKKLKVKLDKENREGILKLNRIGGFYLDLLVEGIPKRVDSDLEASLSLNVKLCLPK